MAVPVGADVRPDPPAGRPRLCAVTRLTVTDFRCYATARLEGDARPIVLTGPNGAGKTNLLEAVSFLAPGRGLRRATLAEVRRRDAPPDAAWGVAAHLTAPGGPIAVGTGIDPAAL
ncbi:MAG: AAA family ATPase, partial [Inquilinaceae bacterium]